MEYNTVQVKSLPPRGLPTGAMRKDNTKDSTLADMGAQGMNTHPGFSVFKTSCSYFLSVVEGRVSRENQPCALQMSWQVHYGITAGWRYSLVGDIQISISSEDVLAYYKNGHPWVVVGLDRVFDGDQPRRDGSDPSGHTVQAGVAVLDIVLGVTWRLAAPCDESWKHKMALVLPNCRQSVKICFAGCGRASSSIDVLPSQVHFCCFQFTYVQLVDSSFLTG